MAIINKYYKKNPQIKNTNIILIGFMGTGKTSVSSKLSKMLKLIAF